MIKIIVIIFIDVIIINRIKELLFLIFCHLSVIHFYIFSVIISIRALFWWVFFPLFQVHFKKFSALQGHLGWTREITLIRKAEQISNIYEYIILLRLYFKF